MLHFEGTRDLPQPPAEVSAKLSDARFLAQCIPGAESTSKLEPAEAVCVLRPGFAFVRGTIDVTLRMAERAEPNARVQLSSKGIGSSSEVEATLALTPTEAGTKVHWNAEVKNLGGLLKMVPAGLIRGAAEKVINDAWDRIAAKMGDRA